MPAGQRTAAVELTRARIIRDDAIAAFRLNQSGQPQEDMPYPINRISDVRRITAGMLGLEFDEGTEAFGIAQKRLKMIARRNPALSSVLGEHGATLSVTGRMTAWEMTNPGPVGYFTKGHGRLKRKESEQATHMTSHMGRGQAHSFLVLGDDGYDRTSNAVQGARTERAKGGPVKLLKIVPWMGRAAAGLAFTVTHDRRNKLPAVLTFGEKLLNLRSRSAARQSIHDKF